MRHSLIYNYLREPGVSMSQNAYKHPCSKHLIARPWSLAQARTVGKGTHFFSNRDKKTDKKFGTTPFLTKGLGDSERIRTFAPPEPAKPLIDAQMCGSFYNSSVMTDEFLFFQLQYNSFWTSYRTFIRTFLEEYVYLPFYLPFHDIDFQWFKQYILVKQRLYQPFYLPFQLVITSFYVNYD